MKSQKKHSQETDSLSEKSTTVDTMKESRPDISTKTSFLYKPWTRIKRKERIENKTFSLFLKSLSDKDTNPLGYVFSLDRNNRMMYLHGRYRYLSEEEWANLIEDLESFLHD